MPFPFTPSPPPCNQFDPSPILTFHSSHSIYQTCLELDSQIQSGDYSCFFIRRFIRILFTISFFSSFLFPLEHAPLFPLPLSIGALSTTRSYVFPLVGDFCFPVNYSFYSFNPLGPFTMWHQCVVGKVFLLLSCLPPYIFLITLEKVPSQIFFFQRPVRPHIWFSCLEASPVSSRPSSSPLPLFCFFWMITKSVFPSSRRVLPFFLEPQQQPERSFVIPYVLQILSFSPCFPPPFTA